MDEDNTRRTSTSTGCPAAARLLTNESAAVLAIYAVPARPFPVSEFLQFDRAQRRRLEHESACNLCRDEIAGRLA
jgi:hypothetical protein